MTKQNKKKVFDESMEFFNSMQTNLDALVKLNRDGAHKASSDSTSAVKSGLIFISVGIILAVLIGDFCLFRIN